jgi:D-alanyl-D-alanine dipeptidase
MNEKYPANSWRTILDSKKNLLKSNNTTLIGKQFVAFNESMTPKIADPVIKSIRIIENNEILVDLNKTEDKRISMMPKPGSPFLSPNYNSGFDNSSKMRLSLYEKLEKMLVHLDELAQDFGYQPGQVGIKVFEGLRDLDTQNTLFENKKKEIAQARPELKEEELEAETCKWVSPVKNNIPVHSTGAAVDIRLWDNKIEEFVDMGLFGVIWGANPNAPTFSENISEAQKYNRLYCLMAAEKAGLTNYSYEFWHFSYNDRYASYWQEMEASKRCAAYGPDL